jgi:hypothetical protein
MLVILISILLALVLYLFVYLRSELFRITERQSNTLVHMARMHRGLLGGIANIMNPPLVADVEPMPTPPPEPALPTVEEVDGENVVEEDGGESA